MRLYRAALHLYPRRFRRDYGDAMVALVADQLRAEPAARVVGRTVLDLFVTVPTRHLEELMPRSTTTPLVVLFVAAAGAFAVFGGPVGLGLAAGLLALAVLTWRRSRPLVAAEDTRWWKLLLAGVVLLGAFALVTTVVAELPQAGWYVAMATLFTSFGLIGAGAVQGLSRRLRSLPGA